jgi:hypothetical protein
MLFTNKQKSNIPIIKKIILWYFRIFGLTFGGFTLNKNEEFIVNRKLKIFGHIYTILIIVTLNILYLTSNKSYIDLEAIYNSGYKIVYHLIIIGLQLSRLLIFFNFGYIQLRGFELFKVLFSYPINTLKNKIILSILLGIAVAIQITILAMNINSAKNYLSLKYFLIVIFGLICNIVSLIVIPLITFGKCNTNKSKLKLLFWSYFMILLNKSYKFHQSLAKV